VNAMRSIKALTTGMTRRGTTLHPAFPRHPFNVRRASLLLSVLAFAAIVSGSASVFANEDQPKDVAVVSQAPDLTLDCHITTSLLEEDSENKAVRYRIWFQPPRVEPVGIPAAGKTFMSVSQVIISDTYISWQMAESVHVSISRITGKYIAHALPNWEELASGICTQPDNAFFPGATNSTM